MAGTGAAAAVWLSGILRVIAVAAAAYGAYRGARLAARRRHSHVTTSEVGLTHLSADGDEVSFRWDGITHAGTYRAGGGRDELYVYNRPEDRLLIIPAWYRQFESLTSEVRAKTPFLELELAEHERIADRLRHITE